MAAPTVRITHPFHPLCGHSFEVVSQGGHWGEDRVIYRAADGTLPTIALALTDLAPDDAFLRLSGGRAAFRMVDLQRLVELFDRLGMPERSRMRK